MASFRIQEFGGNIDSVYNPQIFESKIGSKEPKNRLKFNSEKVSKHGPQFILNAIFYLIRSGCNWRLLPHDLPPSITVYSQFIKWRKRRVFKRLQDHVRGTLRALLEIASDRSAGIIDHRAFLQKLEALVYLKADPALLKERMQRLVSQGKTPAFFDEQNWEDSFWGMM